MKNTAALNFTAIALAALLTGCAAADTSTTAANVEMRVQDGYIQYYNGTDWENLISTEELKGEKGDKGDKGDPGEKGERGETGPRGAKGDKGDPGISGSDGANGQDGTNGKDGANGKNGVDGKDGANGKDGINGKDGANGKDGVDGKDGINGKDGVDGKDGVNGKDGVDGKDGKDGKDGVDGKDGKDGKDGVSTVPGITRSIDIYSWNYYTDYYSTYESGHLEIADKQNVVLNDRTKAFDADNSYSIIALLLNEDGALTVNAVPGDGWTFLHWSDGDTNPTRTITYADKTYLRAYFCPVTPVLSWDNLKPSSGESAHVEHSYSETEPWVDITYTSPYFSTWVRTLGDGIVLDSGDDSEENHYVDIRHSTNTVIRYSKWTSRSDIGSPLPLQLSFRDGTATLRIQVLQDDVPVDPETVLPPLSSVDWLTQE